MWPEVGLLDALFRNICRTGRDRAPAALVSRELSGVLGYFIDANGHSSSCLLT